MEYIILILLVLVLVGLIWDIYLRLHPKPITIPESFKWTQEKLEPVTISSMVKASRYLLGDRQIDSRYKEDLKRDIIEKLFNAIGNNIALEKCSMPYERANLMRGVITIWIKPLRTKGGQ